MLISLINSLPLLWILFSILFIYDIKKENYRPTVSKNVDYLFASLSLLTSAITFIVIIYYPMTR